MIKKTLLSIILTYFLATGFSQQIQNDGYNYSLEQKAVTMAPDIISRLVYSLAVNDEFKLNISFPQNYDPYREKKYPVVYQLDGKFLLPHTIVADYFAEEIIPEVIVIGIAYPATNQRDRDYTYGFKNFYRFLKYELIPLVEKEYNADPNCRILTGYSYGGLCCLQAMFEFTDPEKIVFQNIIAGSPSIWWPDNTFVYSQEAKLYSQTAQLPINLYMALGSLDSENMRLNFKTFTKILSERKYQNLKLHYQIDDGFGHNNTHTEYNFRNGIKWIFSQIGNNTTSIKNEKEVIPYRILHNPNSGKFLISFETGNAKDAKIDVYSINGKAIHSIQNCNANSVAVNLSGCLIGIYIVKISKGSKVFTEKIIVN